MILKNIYFVFTLRIIVGKNPYFKKNDYMVDVNIPKTEIKLIYLQFCLISSLLYKIDKSKQTSKKKKKNDQIILLFIDCKITNIPVQSFD